MHLGKVSLLLSCILMISLQASDVVSPKKIRTLLKISLIKDRTRKQKKLGLLLQRATGLPTASLLKGHDDFQQSINSIHQEIAHDIKELKRLRNEKKAL